MINVKDFTTWDSSKKEWVFKSGTSFVETLKENFKLKNKNDFPFLREDIIKEPEMKDFNFKGLKDFKKICELEVKTLTFDENFNRVKNERIVPINFTDEESLDIFKNALGVCYILTSTIEAKEYIVKIGSSRTSFEKRLQSYNCGTLSNWRTASTTNFKILQSMVACREKINLYLYFCGEPIIYEWQGIKSVPFSSTKPLAVEDILVKEFIKKFNKKPLANIQANATVI